MKTSIALILLSLFSLSTFAQDYTQWSLPEGAKMRLGKGRLSGNIAYSPDGTRLAVASEIGIWLYDATTHQEVALLTGHTSEVTSVAFSPDGQTIVSASYRGTILLWDAHTGTQRQTLSDRTSGVTSVAFSPDGQTIASASWSWRNWNGWNYTTTLWDVRTGTQRQTLTRHTSGVTSVAFSPDGQTIASASSAGEVWLWDVQTGTRKQTLTGHTSGVYSVAFSPDGNTIASASSAGEVWLWDVHTGTHRQTLKGHANDVYSIAFSPDGNTIASASRDYTVRLWDARTGTQKQTLTGHTSAVISVAFSPDGQTIASASWDHTVRLWDAHNGTQKQTLRGHTSTVYSVAFSPDGNTIASANGDHTVRLWDAHTGTNRQTLTGHTSTVYSVAFSPDGNTIASASGAHHIVQQWRASRDYTGPWTPSGDYTVRLWDTHTGEHKQTLKGHTYGITSVAFSPDGKTIAGASLHSTTLLWDVHTGAHKTLRDRISGVTSVAFSPDGNTIANASGQWDWEWGRGFSLRLWDARTEEHKQTLYHTAGVTSVAFSPDGKTIASASGGLWWRRRGPEMRLWDAHTGAHKQTLDHTHGVHSVAFSPDGNTIAGASHHGTILLWDVTQPPVDMSVPLGFAVEQWSSLKPGNMDFIANPEYGTGIMGTTIRNTASAGEEVLLWRFSAGGEELFARIPANLVKAVSTVRFDQTGRFGNKLFVAISAGPVGRRTTRVVIVEPNGEFRDAINIYDGNSTQASIEFSSPAGAYIYDADGDQGHSFYRLDESFQLHSIASHAIPPDRSDIDLIDLKFDSTGKYGGLLTLSDTDLNHDELSGLYQLQANGAWQALVPPTSVRKHQFQGIAFSNAGPLGSALYVADALTDNIWVVTPKGAIEAFAVGFTNPRRVVIGPQGADMWVADQTGLYRIFSTDPSDWEAAKTTSPVTSGLEPNYPNPFNRSTQISYRVSAPGPVRLVIHNALGQPVRTLVDEIQATGAYQVPWDGRDHSGAHVANGLYLCRLQAGTVTQVRKMMVLK